MKIGILTYHRTLNYGACLQAFATRVILEKFGHEVYYVDYWPTYHKSKYELFSWYIIKTAGIKKIMSYMYLSLKYYSLRKKRIENFKDFQKKYIEPYCRSIQEKYDVVIYGSDQIWRWQKEIQEYNPVYFGYNDIDTKKHVSYAASMGILPDSKEKENVIKEYVSHLDKISVREKDLKIFLEKLGFSNVHLDLDPTLLVPKSLWDTIVSPSCITNEKYLLLYIMGANGFDMNEVYKFASFKKLKVKILRGYAYTRETNDNIVTASPEVFLGVLKGAEYVLSSSFHGLAFSIIYHKQCFASFLRNSGRAASLLESLGISERLLPAKSKIPMNIGAINYEEVDKMLQSYQTISLDYLTNLK